MMETEREMDLECTKCHKRFANKMYLQSHILIEHEKGIAPSGVG